MVVNRLFWLPVKDQQRITSLHFRPANDVGTKRYGSTSAIDLPIVAIDGEGYNSEDGDHHYDLIAAASDTWTDYKDTANAELTFEEIAEFLLSLPEKYGKALYFIYGGSYDFNMWVKRLPDSVLKKLIKYGRTRHNQYKISWVPRREILIQDKLSFECKIKHRGKNKGQHIHSYRRKIHIYDVIGFFQMSFVKALEDWKTTDQETIDRIASMKKQRGNFSEVEKQDILKYCLEECKLLVQLGNDFKAACNRADIRPYHWYGAGALATTLMRRFGVKNFISEAPEVKRYWAHAYFGGRTEISYQGRLPNGGYQYDINSAYPTAMLDIPCLIHGEWNYHLDGSENYYKYQYGIWHVKWNCHGKLWGPFPWRDKKGRIFYPDTGEGFYHKVEIDAALALYPDCIFDIYEGWTFTPKCNHKPFFFIAEKAAYRLKLKLDGEPAHKPLKLGLNSLYGKTAQTIGRKPPYQNFFWAGLITATTRAKLLDAIRYCSGTIYSVATDGLISSTDIPELQVGTSLGTWECTKIIEGLLVRPGVYKWLDPKGKWHYGTRGFMADEADWEEIEESWDSGNVLKAWSFNATRFIGLRQALHRGEKWRNYFGKWVTDLRKVTFIPTLGTRWWDTPNKNNSPFPDITTSFVRLKINCNCSNNGFCEGASNIYVRLREEDFDDLIKQLIDEEQP